MNDSAVLFLIDGSSGDEPVYNCHIYGDVVVMEVDRDKNEYRRSGRKRPTSDVVFVVIQDEMVRNVVAGGVKVVVIDTPFEYDQGFDPAEYEELIKEIQDLPKGRPGSKWEIVKKSAIQVCEELTESTDSEEERIQIQCN